MNAHTRAEALRLVDEIRRDVAWLCGDPGEHAAANCDKLRALLSASDDVPEYGRTIQVAAEPPAVASGEPTAEEWRTLVDELATDLENEIENRRAVELPRRIERDLDVVRRARAMLSAAPPPNGETKMSDDLVQRLAVAVSEARAYGYGAFADVADFALHEIERLRAEVEELDGLRMELDGLTARYEERTAYTITHRGMALTCSEAMRQAYSDQTVRAERAESERDALRERIASAVVSVLGYYDGKRVALVVLDP